jgi:hypothetical protein
MFPICVGILNFTDNTPEKLVGDVKLVATA